VQQVDGELDALARHHPRRLQEEAPVAGEVDRLAEVGVEGVERAEGPVEVHDVG